MLILLNPVDECQQFIHTTRTMGQRNPKPLIFSLSSNYVAPQPTVLFQWNDDIQKPRTAELEEGIPTKFVPVGQDKVLISYKDSNQIQLLNIHSGTIEQRITDVLPWFSYDSSNGESLLYATTPSEELLVYDLNTKELIKQVMFPTKVVRFFKNPSLLYHCDVATRKITVWDVRSHSIFFSGEFDPMLEWIEIIPHDRVALYIEDINNIGIVKVKNLITNEPLGKFLLPGPAVSIVPVDDGNHLVIVARLVFRKNYPPHVTMVTIVADTTTGKIIREVPHDHRVLKTLRGCSSDQLVFLCDNRSNPDTISGRIKRKLRPDPVKGFHITTFDWRKGEFVHEINTGSVHVQEVAVHDENLVLMSNNKLFFYYGERFSRTMNNTHKCALEKNFCDIDINPDDYSTEVKDWILEPNLEGQLF
jgi:hypothetical protein